MATVSKKNVEKLEEVQHLLYGAQSIINDLQAYYSPNGETGYMLDEVDNGIGIATGALSDFGIYEGG